MISVVQAHDSASKQEEVAVWEDERQESKCALKPTHNVVPNTDTTPWTLRPLNVDL